MHTITKANAVLYIGGIVLRKTLALLLAGIEHASARIAIGGALLTFATNPGVAQPAVPVRELALTDAEIRKYSAKHTLKQARSGLIQLVQHRSHSSHSSHRSHASHYSGSSGGGSGVYMPPRPAPSPAPATPSPAPEAARPLYERPADAATLADDFNDNLRSSTMWKVGVLAPDPAAADSLIKVTETNHQLEITVPARKIARRFNGYVSADELSLTDAYAEVEVVRVPLTGAQAVFGVAKDSANWYGFRIADGMLTFESVVAGKSNSQSVLHDSVAHRYLRLVHNSLTQLLVWQTSRDGIRWQPAHFEVPGMELSGMNVTLVAGAEGTLSQPATVVFDNFVYRRR